MSFEVHIPWQTENYYSLRGNCKYPGLNIYIYKCSPRQEHTYLPWLVFCIPWYLPISGAPHTSSLTFLIIACKVFFFLWHIPVLSLLFLIKQLQILYFFYFHVQFEWIPNSTIWWIIQSGYMQIADCDEGFEDSCVCKEVIL